MHLLVLRSDLIRRVSLLRCNAMAAPFEKAFDAHRALAEQASASLDETAATASKSEVMVIHYRDEEVIYIQAAHDQVTVIFAFLFRDKADRILGKAFLSEFENTRRRALHTAPQVLYMDDPPLEIRGVPGVLDAHGQRADDFGYITFVLAPRHVTQQRSQHCITHLQSFREYFHDHIKAAKVSGLGDSVLVKTGELTRSSLICTQELSGRPSISRR